VASPAVPTTRLTPRERDVAALVRRGYTNKEVAAELFLTAKTVEFHLRNIYAKVGVIGRQQLRRLDGS
jgi:DNA-binding CsgD family transcriptional regulator